MTRRLVSLIAAALVAGCADGPTEPVPELGISWLEWPTAVTTSQGGELRISGNGTCLHRPVHSVAIRNNEVQITTLTARQDAPCLHRGTGAGYDTVLALPRLPGSPDERLWPIRARMLVVSEIYRRGAEDLQQGVRVVGYLELRPAADTTTKLAGFVQLRADSAAACWLARPYSAGVQPEFAFSRPVPLPPAGPRSGFVTGHLMHAAPPICGRPLAIDASELTVDATPF